MKVVFHPDYYNVYTSDPAAEAGRLEAVMEVIEPHVTLVKPGPAEEDDIRAVHTESHVDYVRRWGLYDTAALAAGGAVEAASIGLKEPCFGLIRPPGHHASSDSAWGFCYFNNMAVAIDRLKRAGKIQSAYILDIDLHYGDGTVNILKHREGVVIHNVEAHSREDYMREVREEMSRCEADLVAVSAGFDNHERDWGGTLHTEDYQDIGRWVREAAQRSGGGCFAVLEGGYNHEVLGWNVMALIEGMSGD